MHPRRTFITVLLVLSVLLSAFLEISCPVRGETIGWQVDIYTQKDLYNGKGLGEPSDSFASQHTVILYANVTYNMGAVQNTHVSFSVQGPLNPVENYSMSLSTVTDHSGVAETDFTLPWSTEDPETATFGLWKATAYTKNVSDSLTFRVGWMIDLVSLQTVEDDPPQGGWLRVELQLKNIALTTKNATLALMSSDSSGKLIATQIVEDLRVDPEGTNLSIQLHIPYWASPGMATVNSSVYSPSGDPYSPTILSTTFLITLLGDLNGDNKVDMQDLGPAALAFGSYPGHARWNPLADLNKDERVDMTDIALVAREFGNTYP